MTKERVIYHVKAHLVDGSLLDWHFGQDFVDKLRRLEREGYSGKRLINELISDDWAAPPNTLVISRSSPPMEDIVIPYR